MSHSNPWFVHIILSGSFLTFRRLTYARHKARAIDVWAPYLVKYDYCNQG